MVIKKCKHCKNKITNPLLKFICKCGINDLCSLCKYPNLHNCTFDRVKANQQKLETDNKKIEVGKVQKI